MRILYGTGCTQKGVGWRINELHAGSRGEVDLRSSLPHHGSVTARSSTSRAAARCALRRRSDCGARRCQNQLRHQLDRLRLGQVIAPAGFEHFFWELAGGFPPGGLCQASKRMRRQASRGQHYGKGVDPRVLLSGLSRHKIHYYG